MATYKPELHSVEAVLSYYDQYDESAYQVYAGTKPDTNYCRFTYTGTDKSYGREKLQEALLSVASNPENTNTYLLQIISAKGKKLEPINNITFQLNRTAQYMPLQYQNNNGELLAKLNAIEQRIATMEADDDDDDDETEDVGGIGALFSNPEIKSLLMQGILSAFTKPKQTVAIAGVNDNADEKLAAALEVLKKNVPDLADKLLKLADMSVTEPAKFNMLLKLL